MEKKQQDKLLTFLEKEQASLSKQAKAQDICSVKANILTQDDIEEAAMRLKHGQLVAFPTETVYGLGANALDATALKKIYQTKKRPLTDPIIVHVLDDKQAEKLVQMNEKQRVLFELLTIKYWPGPLTIILKANTNLLPMIVTAQTGFVGIRSPKHPVARKLIEISGLPIGAPSANLFSHVSPTEPVHVFNDFYNCDLSIIAGGRCEFGVESTVIKLLDDEIHVLREGSLSVSKLQQFLKAVLPEKSLPAVVIHRKVVNKDTNMQAPGQALKHYAPYLPCYFFSGQKIGDKFYNKANNHCFNVAQTAFISFDEKRFEVFKTSSKHYFEVGYNIQEGEEGEEQELFCSKEEKSKMREIYFLLRRCENLSVSGIVIGWSEQREGTVWDKIFRSTQGEYVECIE